MSDLVRERSGQKKKWGAAEIGWRTCCSSGTCMHKPGPLPWEKNKTLSKPHPYARQWLCLATSVSNSIKFNSMVSTLKVASFSKALERATPGHVNNQHLQSTWGFIKHPCSDYLMSLENPEVGRKVLSSLFLLMKNPKGKVFARGHPTCKSWS